MGSKGLVGVVAARTALSHVYGEEGRVVYGGYEIDALAEHSTERGKRSTRTSTSSASVYYSLGIPQDLFTNVFACARMAGRTTHVMEQ